MPLIQVKQAKKEKEFKLTSREKDLRDGPAKVPEEQLKAANHNGYLLDLIVDAELRDANPEATRYNIYRALELRDIEQLLAASKNLTVKEKNNIVQGIYQTLLARKKEDYLISCNGRTILDEKKLREDTKRLSILSEGPVDLVDLCLRLSKD